MKNLKQVLRLLGLGLFIIFAAFGLGFTGNILPTYRERYMNNRIKTEQTDKKKEDDEESYETKH